MEPFLKKFFPEVYTKKNEDTKISNYCKFDSQLLTSFTSSLYIAGLVASLFASSVTKAFGRKSSILVGGIAFLVGSALAWCSFECVHAYIWSNFAWNWCWFCQPEMAPPNYRGATNIGFDLCVRIGVLSANLINFGSEKIKGGWGWRISLAMSAVPASILTLGIVFTFISMLIVDKLGRRALFMIGGIQMFLSQIIIGGLMAAQLGDQGAQTFFTMLCHFKSGIFFFFGGWVVVMSSFVYFLLPETKNVPIEQMNRVWSEHWFWKRIVGEVNDDIKVEAP
uniref:Major facilitator superfamily (MFS) profile domain-containing protein n=1 Tax=Fagus sylvatica TaxID=28930 RepID=A0A2N9HRD2_FAGSY